MSYPEEQLWEKINDGWTRMSFRQRRFWDAIRRPPEEWELRGYDRCWVVALIGSTAIYYNHLEHGFNRSAWTEYGVIDHFQSLQDGLDEAVQRQLDVLDTGNDVGPWASPPFPGEYPKS
jgi:hypothetical protein